MIDFISNKYERLGPIITEIIGGGYFIYKKNKFIIKNRSKGIQAGRDINITINENSKK